MTTNSQHAEDGQPRTAAMNRGFDVLELVVDSGQVRLAEVAKALGISRATAFRALSALRRRGYIEHVPSEQIYRLGTGFITLAARSAASSIVRLASSVMADLRNETLETVNLALMRGGQLIYVSVFDGPQALRITPKVGAEAALHATALGKAVLMMMSPEDQDRLLGSEPYRTFTPNTIVSRKALDQELATSLARGYSVDREEEEPGGMCLAVPIVDERGYPFGGLSVAGPVTRMRRLGERQLGRRLRECSDEIGTKLQAGREKSAKVPRASHRSV